MPLAAPSILLLTTLLCAQDPPADLLVSRRAGPKDLMRTSAPAADTLRFALGFLSRTQAEDGRWDADGFLAAKTAAAGAGQPLVDIGVTGLALLAMLGESHAVKGNPYETSIRRGLRWLGEQQAEDGVIGARARQTYMYDHAIASLALAEAVAAGAGDEVTRQAQAALDALEAHRNPFGAWRYGKRDGDNDSSVTAWAALAMFVGSEAGLAIPGRTLASVAAWYDEVTDETTGRCGYTARGGASSRNADEHALLFPPELGEAMTAAALVVRRLMGEPKDQSRSRALVLACPPTWEKTAADPYYWHFAALALALGEGGEESDAWRSKLVELLAVHQRKDGDLLGSFDPVGPWGATGGRIYSTALAAMALQAPYRYRAGK